ncbi:ribokinase [Gemmiger formicilis]|uniref:ribokinase n=1 Tax=Gemmiger formicilis TaxID=745368 RepID=UPI001957F234|nr:ribokinase [Gemmiger formicilis]MBM6913934.1 ribokinase [Gemmiger formicilis]
MKILNFGSLNIDYVYRVPRMVCPKETLACDGMEQFLGGKGFNQSVALARAGAPVFHAGLIGEDGGVFLDACREYGIDAGHIRRIPGRSGHTIIQVDPAGENCILLYGGANRALDEAYIEQVLADFSAGDILLLQNEVNCLDVLIRAAHRRGMRILLNPSPCNEALDACDLRLVDCLLVNEVEGEQLSGESDPARIPDAILRRYPGMSVLLTLGSRGAVFARQGQRVYQPAIRAGDTVDTTAAGDTFTGYFAAGLLEGLPVEQNLRRSAAAAGIAVTRKGASPSIPGLAQTEALLASLETV